jgi:hypothetical protein
MNKSIQQTVIHLVPIMHNPRITLFPCSNIQENLTINAPLKVMVKMNTRNPQLYVLTKQTIF